MELYNIQAVHIECLCLEFMELWQSRKELDIRDPAPTSN